MNCPQCMTANKTSAKFCKSCGYPIETEKLNPRRCSLGHIMDPSWNFCRICASSSGTDEKPSGQPRGTTIGENPIDTETLCHPAVKQNPSESPDSSVSLDEVRRPMPQEPARTMVFDDNGALAPSPQEKDCKLKGFLVSFSRIPQGEYFALHNIHCYMIGRSKKMDISFAQDSLMSESHAQMKYVDDHFEYQDNMSTNGSYINGKRIDQRTTINNYDLLKMGNTELLLIMVYPDGKEK